MPLKVVRNHRFFIFAASECFAENPNLSLIWLPRGINYSQVLFVKFRIRSFVKVWLLRIGEFQNVSKVGPKKTPVFLMPITFSRKSLSKVESYFGLLEIQLTH